MDMKTPHHFRWYLQPFSSNSAVIQKSPLNSHFLSPYVHTVKMLLLGIETVSIKIQK